MRREVFDIVQVGYGPVSEALALMLGRQGRSVAICEKWTDRYPLPRAVCIDHEMYRMLSANGLGSVLPSVSHPGPLYQWFSEDWEELLVIDWGASSISGGPEVHFVHQPTLEEALDRAVADQSTVERLLGWEVVSIEQDDDLAHVSLRHTVSGEMKQIDARYVVGCDGANSLVRDIIGGSREDRGFEADWLVIDVRLKAGVTITDLGIPAAGQYCNPRRPTTIVPAGVREGEIFRRWEFMLLPGEKADDLEQEARVWELLSPWVGRDDVDLIRHKVYNFRSLIADRWRDRRLLLAGDSAHVMPPFMGQGMCSGMRDAWNLAWKLGLVLEGKADDRLLNTYQAERLPHVSQIIDLSIYLGKIICMPDPHEAQERDRAFLGGTAEPPPPFPHLVDGLLHHIGDGEIQSGAGLLSPHVMLRWQGLPVRMDDLVDGGRSFVVVTRGVVAAEALDALTLANLASIKTEYLPLATDSADAGTIDLDGRLDAFLEKQGWAAMIIRPDFYVYGGATDSEALRELARDFLDDLAAVGVNFPEI